MCRLVVIFCLRNDLYGQILMRPLLAVIVAYLIGSVPFGYLIVRGKQGSDIRQTGSGGTGATNVSRSAGKLAGVATLVLDAVKGAAAVLVAKLIVSIEGQAVANADWWVTLAAIAVIVGHIFPVWLAFRGGKGVATAIGVFLVVAPGAVLGAGVLFLLIAGLTRYVSLGSMIAAISIPIFIYLLNASATSQSDQKALITAAVIIAVLIIFAHRGNIQRLRSGTESHFRVSSK
jgi:acyl phosphate:glycerol-3-phosphate acyltransferase